MKRVLKPAVTARWARAGRCGSYRLRSAEQHDVLGALYEGQVGQLLDLCLRRAASVAPVELVERLDRRHRRQPRERDPLALVADASFGTQHRFQEVREAGFLVGGVLCQRRPFGAEAIELELFAQRCDPGVLLVHANTSSSSS